jgi:hypothetical protein
MMGGVVPANPGWYAISLWLDADGYSKDPIIAWAINSAGRATPICPAGGADDDHDVLTSDGSVQCWDRNFASVGDWFDARKAKRDEAEPETPRKARTPEPVGA